MFNIGLFVGAYFFMEFIAWTNHKYIMHGFLWKWHKDHHTNDFRKSEDEAHYYKGFEKNDLFSLVYAIPSMLLIICGFMLHINALLFIGFGFTFYGLTYFIIHDIVIHKRFQVPFLQKLNNRYLQALKKAHKAHHQPRNVNDFGNFGLLIFQFRFFKA